MKLRKTYHESQNSIKIAVCIITAVLIFLISFPSFAAEEPDTEKVPETETVITEDEKNEEQDEDEEEEESETESVQTGYITMKAVSGNPSITN